MNIEIEISDLLAKQKGLPHLINGKFNNESNEIIKIFYNNRLYSLPKSEIKIKKFDVICAICEKPIENYNFSRSGNAIMIYGKAHHKSCIKKYRD